MVTPLKVAAANFFSFSVPSPYTVLTAYIAAVIRSLSAGSEMAVLDFLEALLALDLAEALRDRFPGETTMLSDFEAMLAFDGVLDAALDLDFDRREEEFLLLRDDDLGGKGSLIGLADVGAAVEAAVAANVC